MKISVKKYNTNEKLIEYFAKEYSKNSVPISVSFRDIIPNLDTIYKYPHLIHSYPAKLIPHIPNFFLNNNIFSKEGDIILDPFCGSGTVLLESLVSKRNSYGVDANPLARLISKVKTTYIEKDILNKHLEIIARIARFGHLYRFVSDSVSFFSRTLPPKNLNYFKQIICSIGTLWIYLKIIKYQNNNFLFK